MSNSIAIATAADERYFPGLLATIFTLLASSCQRNRFHIHIYDGGITPESKALLERMVRHFGNQYNVEWLRPDLGRFSNLVSMGASRLTYARLMLPHALAFKQVIWLDSDLLVLRDCAELADFDLDGSPIAAALESGGFADDISNMQELGIASDAPYFNAGVMLLDLDRLRECRFSEKSIRYLNNNTGSYRFHDQSAINVVLNGCIAKLPRDWNYLNRVYTAAPDRELVERGGYIYHFLERPKPWQRYSGEPHAHILYGILQLLGKSLPELNLMCNVMHRIKWRMPAITSFYYQVTPRRFSNPDKMLMCRRVWRSASHLKRVSNTRCAERVVNRLKKSYQREG